VGARREQATARLLEDPAQTASEPLESPALLWKFSHVPVQHAKAAESIAVLHALGSCTKQCGWWCSQAPYDRGVVLSACCQDKSIMLTNPVRMTVAQSVSCWSL